MAEKGKKGWRARDQQEYIEVCEKAVFDQQGADNAAGSVSSPARAVEAPEGSRREQAQEKMKKAREAAQKKTEAKRQRTTITFKK